MNTTIDYNSFLQNNVRYNEKEAWPEKLFPDAQYRYFREAGCLVCALAFLLRYHDIEKEIDTDIFNPWVLCEKLIRNNAFSSSADLTIAAIGQLYPLNYLGQVRYSREAVTDAVIRNRPCMITVKGNNGPFHFIALEELTVDDAIVFDPAIGRRYLSEYDSIYQIRMFHLTDR